MEPETTVAVMDTITNSVPDASIILMIIISAVTVGTVVGLLIIIITVIVSYDFYKKEGCEYLYIEEIL